MKLSIFFNKHWYSKSLTWFTILLYPFSIVFLILISIRSIILKYLYSNKRVVDIPTIVIGNISVGGVGKTPLVNALAHKLKQAGYKPGIVSRGYGGSNKSFPLEVKLDNRIDLYGDESYMLKELLDCPVVICPNRSEAVKFLSKKEVDVIISDDGLQHYKMFRDIEIAVVDGVRKFGNGMLLPSGPLREPKGRLKQVDYIVVNGGDKIYKNDIIMRTMPIALINMKTGQEYPPDFLINKDIHAIAGIGDPNKFFKDLLSMNYSITEHPFKDHHTFSNNDFKGLESTIIIMTHKDAIKCQFLSINNGNCFYMKIGVKISDKFYTSVKSSLNQLKIELSYT